MTHKLIYGSFLSRVRCPPPPYSTSVISLRSLAKPCAGRASSSSPRRRADGTHPRSFAGSEPGDRHRAERVLNSEVPYVRYLIGRIMKTYDYINRVVLTLPLSVYEGTWTHSPLSLLCITMILRVRRKILKLLCSPSVASEPGL